MFSTISDAGSTFHATGIVTLGICICLFTLRVQEYKITSIAWLKHSHLVLCYESAMMVRHCMILDCV